MDTEDTFQKRQKTSETMFNNKIVSKLDVTLFYDWICKCGNWGCTQQGSARLGLGSSSVLARAIATRLEARGGRVMYATGPRPPEFGICLCTEWSSNIGLIWTMELYSNIGLRWKTTNRALFEAQRSTYRGRWIKYGHTGAVG